MITQARLKELVHYDLETGIFTAAVDAGRPGNMRRAGDVVGSRHPNFLYLRASFDNKQYKLHRLVWLYVHGRWPDVEVDHINRNRTDNRLANLREVSHRQNCQNRNIYSTNTSGAPGVRWNAKDQRWQAYISFDGKMRHLGMWRTRDEAVAARKTAEMLCYGEHAPTNQVKHHEMQPWQLYHLQRTGRI
jgi:hypothetical protein